MGNAATRNGGVGNPHTVPQSCPEGPQAIKGLGTGVWDGHRLNCGIGGPQFLELVPVEKQSEWECSGSADD